MLELEIAMHKNVTGTDDERCPTCGCENETEWDDLPEEDLDAGTMVSVHVCPDCGSEFRLVYVLEASFKGEIPCS